MNTSFSRRFDALNVKQKQAVLHTEGPLLVLAGPGTGKTELLALRTAHIIKEGLAQPSSILLLTFTEAASQNMRERLLGLIGPEAHRVQIFTFHAFCNYIIGEYREHFYNGGSYVLASDIERFSILETIFASLPHKHVFGSVMPSDGFVYLRDMEARIREIKNGGYTPEDYEVHVTKSLEESSYVDRVLAHWPNGKLSMKTIDAFDEVVELLSKIPNTGEVLATTLRESIEEAKEKGVTAPIASWKRKYTETLEDGTLVSKDSARKEKILSVVEMYRSYEEAMHKAGLFDYNDMILDVAHALKNTPSLRSDIEERYLYIMIDEFQDTNEAQMSVVSMITSAPVHEGRPNICVVGDDDQAIYKFQGAELNHILTFKQKAYKDVDLIVLDTNYRSTPDILSLSRRVVTQGSYRLENMLPSLTKDLASGNTSLGEGSLEHVSFETPEEEYAYTVSWIKARTAAGNKTAILARRHEELRAFATYLDQAGIAYSYTKKQNVFDEQPIRELLTIAEYLVSVTDGGQTKDYLLPEILTFSYLGMTGENIVELSLLAKRSGSTWLEALSKVPSGAQAYRTIIDLLETRIVPLEHALTTIMERSGFKEYYFSDSQREKSPESYLHFLSSLRTLFQAFREYKKDTAVTLEDAVTCVEMYKTHRIPLVDERQGEDALVTLLTAHGAKGLEFENVAIIRADDTLWTKRRLTNKVPVPSAIVPHIAIAGDDEDDFIRLLYVALTRAKENLLVTSSREDVVRYLQGEERSNLSTHFTIKEKAVAFETGILPTIRVSQTSLKELLATELTSYRMPVTHLQNFLDVTQGGPNFFLEQNLLRFPKPISASAAFGTAVHTAIEHLVSYPKFNDGKIMGLPEMLGVFSTTLKRARLGELEEKKELARGEKILTLYHKNHSTDVADKDRTEIDMKEEGVMIGNAHLTGKIDFLREEPDGYVIRDWKTGAGYTDFNEKGLSDYEHIKLHFYKLQLIVYKLLVERSSRFPLPVKSLSLSFVEEDKELFYSPSNEEVARVEKLIENVYKKIQILDLPDIQKYPKTFEGIQQFEHDILEEKL